MRHFFLLALLWLVAASAVPAQFPKHLNASSRSWKAPCGTLHRVPDARRADMACRCPFGYLHDVTSPASKAVLSVSADQPGAGRLAFASAG
jgi:hypothetical protein